MKNSIPKLLRKMELNGTDLGNENMDGSRVKETVCNDLGWYRHNLKRLKEK